MEALSCEMTRIVEFGRFTGKWDFPYRGELTRPSLGTLTSRTCVETIDESTKGHMLRLSVYLLIIAGVLTRAADARMAEAIPCDIAVEADCINLALLKPDADSGWMIETVSTSQPSAEGRSHLNVSVRPLRLKEMQLLEVQVIDTRRHVRLAHEWMAAVADPTRKIEILRGVLDRAAEKAKEDVKLMVVALPSIERSVAPDEFARMQLEIEVASAIRRVPNAFEYDLEQLANAASNDRLLEVPDCAVPVLIDWKHLEAECSANVNVGFDAKPQRIEAGSVSQMTSSVSDAIQTELGRIPVELAEEKPWFAARAKELALVYSRNGQLADAVRIGEIARAMRADDGECLHQLIRDYAKLISAKQHNLEQRRVDELAVLDSIARGYFRLLDLFERRIESVDSLDELDQREPFFVSSVLDASNGFWVEPRPVNAKAVLETSRAYRRRAVDRLAQLAIKRLTAGKEDDREFINAIWFDFSQGDAERWRNIASVFETYRDVPQLAHRVWEYSRAAYEPQGVLNGNGEWFLHFVASLDRPALKDAARRVKEAAEKAVASAEPKQPLLPEPKFVEPAPRDREVSCDPAALKFSHAVAGEVNEFFSQHKSLVCLRPQMKDVSFPAEEKLNDHYSQLAYDGRYVWAPVQRLNSETDQPLVRVLNAQTLATRMITIDDGLPAMNSGESQREFSPFNVVALAPGKVLLIGTGAKTWIATIEVDSQLQPTVRVLYQARNEIDDADDECWRDPYANFIPGGGAWAIGGVDKAEPTHVLINRVGRGGVEAHPMLLSLVDGSITILGQPTFLNGDSLLQHDGELWWLQAQRRDNEDEYRQLLYRFDATRARFEIIRDPLLHTKTQDHRMLLKDGRFIIAGVEWWISDRIDGEYRQLMGLSPGRDGISWAPTFYDLPNSGLLMRYGNEGLFRVALTPR
jgi:hypothetical protein